MARSNLDELNGDELLTRLAEAKEELFNLRFQHATGQLTNYKRIGQVRREVARLLGALRDVEIRAAEALAAGGN
ncbi:MAG: 50S ribosomal protein L29 [Acidimicrobiia bacterium]